MYRPQAVPTACFALGPNATAVTVVPAGNNVRGRVHEYGAAPYLIVGEAAYYTQFVDQRLYCLEPGASPELLTPPLMAIGMPTGVPLRAS